MSDHDQLSAVAATDPATLRTLAGDTAAILARIDAATIADVDRNRALLRAGTLVDEALTYLHRAAGDEVALAAQLAGFSA